MATAAMTCANCNDATSPPGAKFCVKCGKPLSGKIPCPKCKADVPANSRFCVQCGAPMNEALAGRNRWARQPGDFAYRMEIDDVKTVFTKGVAIDEGTRGLLFQDGKAVGVLQPGYHTLQDLTSRLKGLFVGSPVSVLLVDVGDSSLNLRFDRLRTADGDEVSAEIAVSTGLANELDFFVNVVHGQPRVGTADLQSRIQPEVAAVVQGVVQSCRTEELYGNRELTDRIEDELQQALGRGFRRMGLGFHHVEFVDFSGGAYEEIRKQRGELRVDEAKHDLEKDRAKLERKVRELATDERMAKIRDEQGFNDFLKQCEQEAGLKDLLRMQEREELWRQYEERKADHASAREHMLATLGWQRKRERLARQMEYKRDFVLNSQELDTMQRQHRLQEVEREHQAKLDAAQRDFDAQLGRTKQTRDADLEHRAATSDEDFRQLQREAQLGVDLQKQWEDIKDQREQKSIDRGLHKQRGEMEVRQAEEQARHVREQEKLAAMSQMSVEALIASSDKEKAAMLAELKRTETLKGFTEEQILAMAAKDSPAVAQAFAEKFKAADNPQHRKQIEELYERRIQEQQQSTREAQATHKETLQMMRDLMSEALRTQRDTAVAAAQGRETPGPSVIFPPPGSGAAVVSSVVSNPAPAPAPAAPAQTPGMVDCPQCRVKSPDGSQFCGNCGFRFA
jgi:hypothetical protein